jgi:signal transduction histidine kinase
MNRFPALRKNLTYELELDASVSGVWLGDAMRLRQVLINLLNNAIKFTSEGEIRLSASAEFKNDQFSLKFQVSDTGIGISPEKQSAIFDDFTQAEATTSANYGGTGLGLSIVKRLVEMQKGTVSVSASQERERCSGASYHIK